MADIQKVVAARIQATSLSAVVQPSLQPQGPRFGNIIDELSQEISPEEIRTVLWQDGLVQDVTADTIAELNLDVIEDPDLANRTKFQGQVALRIAPGGPVPGDVAGGTSREFSGLVIAVYKRTPIEAAAGTGADYVLIVSPNNGAYFEDLADSFAVLKNQTP
jgi:hypothetical protein